MTTLVTRRHYAELAVHPISPSFARSHVERTLARWGREELTEIAQLIISELVTNAIKATGDFGETGEDDIEKYAMHSGPSEYVWIGLYETKGHVVLEVWDSSRTPPKLTDADPDDLGGRGLRLVNDLAVAWGHRWPKSGGKIVWAALR
ncbi:ATP-binding protein [Streptosporangium sp. NPDC002524]|uniref:ATP-binding protein n=1 Tax=Streptosporangium sp. NPDC002524 TaxID=3154537 RepID=UPI00332AF0E5